MHRILVIDDDPAIVSALRRGLSYQGFAVQTATSGSDALELARRSYPDLVVLDLIMPGLSGLDVLERLRAADSALPILILTARDGPAQQVEGLARGADDYVVKPCTFDVLVARVRALLRRRESTQPAHPRCADLNLDTATRQAHRGDRLIDLTSTEYDLLAQFLEHPRRVLPRALLMQRVWGFDSAATSNVLEVYVSQLRQKLESGGEIRLIQTVRGVGYILREK
jgi:DNA-binding response OmpR family regulator